MLRISNCNPKSDVRIILPEVWHEKMMEFGKLKTSPYEYVIDEIVKDKVTKETYYLCKPYVENKGKTKKDKEFKIAFTESTIRYLIAEEIPDQNMGLSFKEYLPLEDSMLLITNSRNPSIVIPGILKLELELVEINKKARICFNFKIDFTNGSGFTAIKYFCEGNKKSTWKLLLNEDISYMTDYERMFRDTIIHKYYVEKSCKKLADYLEREGAVEHARMLRQRAKEHDNSKIACVDELNALSRIINDKSSLTDSSKHLSPIKQDSIKLHWKNNSHHPEHFKSCIDMSKLDIMEMCCDWYARSMQYKTNFLEFVQNRQRDRFHFPEWMFAEIWHYCKVLASDI